MQKATKVLNMEVYAARVLGRKAKFNLSVAFDDKESNSPFPTTQSAVPYNPIKTYQGPCIQECLKTL